MATRVRGGNFTRPGTDFPQLRELRSGTGVPAWLARLATPTPMKRVTYLYLRRGSENESPPNLDA